QNVRLASRLTSWDIDIMTRAELEKSIAEEDAAAAGGEGADGEPAAEGEAPTEAEGEAPTEYAGGGESGTDEPEPPAPGATGEPPATGTDDTDGADRTDSASTAG
ncbi:MAG TPA: hypothetical protein VK081_14345, partial [Planctomycetota bacterium]|nr:hypothetical protein [Planctomycetota bacterium]